MLINGRQAILGDTVSSGDSVTLKGLPVAPLADKDVILIALNKPVGIVCTAAPTVKQNIVEYVSFPSRVFPVGRLDKDSQGLILLTNRGDLVNRILGAGNTHEKEYRVTVNPVISEDFLAGMSQSVPMLGSVTKPCRVVRESEHEFRITLVQGLNRQIRRMCKHFGYSVQKLERIRIMHLGLEGLSTGQWRELAEDERNQLFQALSSEPSPTATSTSTSAISASHQP